MEDQFPEVGNWLVKTALRWAGWKVKDISDQQAAEQKYRMEEEHQRILDRDAETHQMKLNRIEIAFQRDLINITELRAEKHAAMLDTADNLVNDGAVRPSDEIMEHLSDATRFQTIEGCREYLGKILAQAANRPNSVPASFIAGMKNLGPHEMNEFKDICRWYVPSLRSLVTRDNMNPRYLASANLVNHTLGLEHTLSWSGPFRGHRPFVVGDEVIILPPGPPTLNMGHNIITEFGCFVLTLIEKPVPHPDLVSLCRQKWAKELSPKDTATKGLKLQNILDLGIMPESVLADWRREGYI